MDPMSLRMMDFQCARDGRFELFIEDFDVNDPVRSASCPKCGESAPSIWVKAPGMQPNTGVHAIEFGGRTFRRDDIEEVLDSKETRPGPMDAPDYREKMRDRFSRLIKKELNGELPKEELSDSQIAAVENATAGVSVDPELVRHNNDQMLNAFRTTEFKE